MDAAWGSQHDINFMENSSGKRIKTQQDNGVLFKLFQCFLHFWNTYFRRSMKSSRNDGTKILLKISSCFGTNGNSWGFRPCSQSSQKRRWPHSLVVEVKLLHEGIGHTVTCELKTGVLVGIGFAKSEGMNKNVAWAWMFIYFFYGVVRNGEQLLSSLTWNKHIPQSS